MVSPESYSQRIYIYFLCDSLHLCWSLFKVSLCFVVLICIKLCDQIVYPKFKVFGIETNLIQSKENTILVIRFICSMVDEKNFERKCYTILKLTAETAPFIPFTTERKLIFHREVFCLLRLWSTPSEKCLDLGLTCVTLKTVGVVIIIKMILNVGHDFTFGNCKQWSHISGGSRIFPRGVRQLPKVLLFFNFVPENCMKMKEFGVPGGGRASLAPPLRSANAYDKTEGNTFRGECKDRSSISDDLETNMIRMICTALLTIYENTFIKFVCKGKLYMVIQIWNDNW